MVSSSCVDVLQVKSPSLNMHDHFTGMTLSYMCSWCSKSNVSEKATLFIFQSLLPSLFLLKGPPSSQFLRLKFCHLYLLPPSGDFFFLPSQPLQCFPRYPCLCTPSSHLSSCPPSLSPAVEFISPSALPSVPFIISSTHAASNTIFLNTHHIMAWPCWKAVNSSLNHRGKMQTPWTGIGKFPE